MDICIITGSSGLVGSESVKFYCDKGYKVIGIDNDMRKYFFGTSTLTIKDSLINTYNDRFTHHSIDIRDRNSLENIFQTYKDNIKCIIHCAAQPSHDWAAREPFTDFEINAMGTLNLLELTRKYCITVPFIFMSTNKVYGDTPNMLPLIEQEKRFEVLTHGVNETMSIDQCKHSIFGVSKVSADIMVQEYGRYFGMNTVVFRGGCITGPNHQGAQLHGFLSYIVKCIFENTPYTIFGYKGKQVRDNIHSYDLVNAFWNYHQNPRPAAVYNIGGGRENSLSILETIDLVNSILGTKWDNYKYIEQNRSGDHIWYITDFSKFQRDYPNWKINYSINRIIKDILCNLSSNTITAVLQGGVGNQMFQIATAYTISKTLNLNLKFLKNQFAGCIQGSHPSNYYKTLFAKVPFVDSLPIDAEIQSHGVMDTASTEQIIPFFEGKSNTTISLHGYFQTDANFLKHTEEIKDLFIPPLGIIGHLERYSDLFVRFPELKETHDFAFIGIRRGDYIKHYTFHNPCGMNFYTKAMNMLNNERYYILSDDYDWVKKNFVGDKFRYLEIKDDFLQLLSSCLFKNYIISNSTFYWWGSLLSVYQNPRIIAPDKWIFGPDAKKDSYWPIYRASMEVIERTIETE